MASPAVSNNGGTDMRPVWALRAFFSAAVMRTWLTLKMPFRFDLVREDPRMGDVTAAAIGLGAQPFLQVGPHRCAPAPESHRIPCVRFHVKP